MLTWVFSHHQTSRVEASVYLAPCTCQQVLKIPSPTVLAGGNIPPSAKSVPTRLCLAVTKLEMATSAGVVSCLGSGLWWPGTGRGSSASY